MTVLPTNLQVALQIGKSTTNTYVNVSNRFTVPPAEGSLVTIKQGASTQLCLGFDQQTATIIATSNTQGANLRKRTSADSFRPD